MNRYQLRDVHGSFVAEGSFGAYDEAKAWASEQNIFGGWTLYRRQLGKWVVAQRNVPQDAK